MTKTQSGAGKVAAVLLTIVSLAASGLLAVRCYRLRDEVNAENQIFVQTRERMALATLDSFSLPPNRSMAVCNKSAKDITISALTTIYVNSQGKLRNFNSAKDQWHTWLIPAGSKQFLDMRKQGISIWDGSVVFYAMDIGREPQSLLVSGTSDNLKSGCISLPENQAGERN